MASPNTDSQLPPHIQKLVDEDRKQPLLNPPDDKDGERKSDEDNNEENFLIGELKARHKEPGVWAVAVGPKMVVSMFNMNFAAEYHLSADSISWATNLAGGSESYRQISEYNIDERFAWIEGRARGADSWNRSIESGIMLQAAECAFNGMFDKIYYSDMKEAEGKNFSHASARGRTARHYPTVRGWLAKAHHFALDDTSSLAVNAWRLEEILPVTHKRCGAMHPVLNTWKVATIDARHMWAEVEAGKERRKRMTEEELEKEPKERKLPKILYDEMICRIEIRKAGDKRAREEEDDNNDGQPEKKVKVEGNDEE